MFTCKGHQCDGLDENRAFKVAYTYKYETDEHIVSVKTFSNQMHIINNVSQPFIIYILRFSNDGLCF